jgi:uncharacterized protein YaeQ
MALKATIYKVAVQVSDLDRNEYSDHNLTIARHPSETEVAMEDLWKTLSNTLNLIHFKPHPTIHTHTQKH